MTRRWSDASRVATVARGGARRRRRALVVLVCGEKRRPPHAAGPRRGGRASRPRRRRACFPAAARRCWRRARGAPPRRDLFFFLVQSADGTSYKATLAAGAAGVTRRGACSGVARSSRRARRARDAPRRLRLRELASTATTRCSDRGFVGDGAERDGRGAASTRASATTAPRALPRSRRLRRHARARLAKSGPRPTSLARAEVQLLEAARPRGRRPGRRTGWPPPTSRGVGRKPACIAGGVLEVAGPAPDLARPPEPVELRGGAPTRTTRHIVS